MPGEDRPPQHIRRAFQQTKEAHKVRTANLLMQTANMLVSAAAASDPLTQDRMQSVSEDANSEDDRKIPSNWKIEDIKKPVAPIAETTLSAWRQSPRLRVSSRSEQSKRPRVSSGSSEQNVEEKQYRIKANDLG